MVGSGLAWIGRGFGLLLGICMIAGTSACGELGNVEAMRGIAIDKGWVLQDAAKVAGTGEEISTVGFAPGVGGRGGAGGKGGWHQAVVPGTVLTSLVKEGIYPEPLYGENNRPDIIPESLCRTSYWYRTEFAVPAEYAGRRVWLNFEGINYMADVWINGKRVGDIKGAFSRGIFDVTDLVRAGDMAAVAVHILPPLHPGNPQEQTQALGTGRNGGELMRDGATFGCTVGWDWIPAIRDRDMGIWREVRLRATGSVVVQDPCVSSELPLPRTDEAELTLRMTLRNATDHPQPGEIRASFESGAFTIPITLAPQETREIKITSADAPVLHVKNPRLWWPNTYGEPHLYTMRVAFAEYTGSIVGGTDTISRNLSQSPAGAIRDPVKNVPPPVRRSNSSDFWGESDVREIHFGIRQITYHVPKDQNLIPQSENLTLFVNGVPIMCKGGCWGMDEAMKRIPRERLEAQVRFHQLANCTMIRNWVGQSTSEDFYDLCDRYGILVWDEMFQANASDGPPVDDVDMYLANVREKVARFRGHPCIALWCGRNESYPAPPAVAEGIARITADLDPARFYQANSGDGRGVRSGGPYYWRVPSAYYSGAGFGRGGTAAPLEPFKTELGSVSIPTLEAIKAMMPEKDWYDVNDDWASHDLCSGAQRGNTYPLELADRYGFIAAGDLKDFARKSQLAMYETYRAMYEGRMARLFDPCTGVLTWMSNPAQPSFVWQLYSYDLEPLAALYGAKKGCEPLHIQMNQSDFHLVVINTAPQEKADLQARVRIFNMDGALASERTFPAAARACAATDLGEMIWPPEDPLSPVHFVKLELLDREGRMLSDNFYWRSAQTVAPTLSSGIAGGFGAEAAQRGGRGGILGRVIGSSTPLEDLSLLQTLQTVELQVTLRRQDQGGSCHILADLFNPTDHIALQAHMQLRRENSGQRVLPVFYSDNYVSLVPGERRTIAIDAELRDLQGEPPLLVVDGWNVTAAERTFTADGGARVSTNRDACVAPKPPGTQPGM